jgi:hypothetical protein
MDRLKTNYHNAQVQLKYLIEFIESCEIKQLKPFGIPCDFKENPKMAMLQMCSNINLNLEVEELEKERS